MCSPEAQDYHSDARVDDPKIIGASRLLRHCRTPVQVVPCPVNGQKVSDRAFVGKKGEAGVSIDLECLLIKDGHPPTHRFGAMPNTYAMIAVTADVARANSAGVAWTPKPEEDLPGAAGAANPYHGEIITPISGGQARAIHRASETIHSNFVPVTKP